MLAQVGHFVQLRVHTHALNVFHYRVLFIGVGCPVVRIQRHFPKGFALCSESFFLLLLRLKQQLQYVHSILREQPQMTGTMTYLCSKALLFLLLLPFRFLASFLLFLLSAFLCGLAFTFLPTSFLFQLSFTPGIKGVSHTRMKLTPGYFSSSLKATIRGSFS